MTKVEKCFCAFCKNERSIDRKKQVDLKDVFYSLALACLMSFILFQRLDASLLTFSICFLGVIQFLVHVKWRMSIVCTYCGFDPVLYKKNPEQACLKVKNFMDLRKSKSNYFLSSKTLDKLSVRRLSLEEKSKLDAEQENALIGLKAPSAKEASITSSNISNEISSMQPM